MMTTMTKRRTTPLIAEDPEICSLVVRSLDLLFKTLVETLQIPRTSSRTFSQRRKRRSHIPSLRGLDFSDVSLYTDRGSTATRSVPPARKMLPAHLSRPISEVLAPQLAARALNLEPFPTRQARQARVLLPAGVRSFPW